MKKIDLNASPKSLKIKESDVLIVEKKRPKLPSFQSNLERTLSNPGP